MNNRQIGSELIQLYCSEESRFYRRKKCLGESKRQLKRRVLKYAKVYLRRLPKSTKITTKHQYIAMYIVNVYTDDLPTQPSKWMKMCNKYLEEPFKNLQEFTDLFYWFLRSIDYRLYINIIN